MQLLKCLLARDLIVNGLSASVEATLKKTKELLLVMEPLVEDATPWQIKERENLLLRRSEIFDKIVSCFIFTKSPGDSITAKLKSQLVDNKDKWFRAMFNMLTGSQSSHWLQPAYLTRLMLNHKVFSPFTSGVTVEELNGTRLPMTDPRISDGPGVVTTVTGVFDLL